MKKTELKMRTATCLILLTVSGIAGITALFLPFTMDISPVWFVLGILVSDSLDKEFWLFYLFYLPLAIPFFLSVFVSTAFLRWMISGLLSRLERAIAYMTSSMMSLGILYFMTNIILIIARPLRARYWLTVVVPLVLLIFGVYIVIKNLRSKGPKEVSAVMAMQTVYLSNALLCLMLFFKDEENWPIVMGWQIGAYFIVVAAGVYLTQIVMASLKLGVFRSGGKSSSA